MPPLIRIVYVVHEPVGCIVIFSPSLPHSQKQKLRDVRRALRPKSRKHTSYGIATHKARDRPTIKKNYKLKKRKKQDRRGEKKKKLEGRSFFRCTYGVLSSILSVYDPQTHTLNDEHTVRETWLCFTYTYACTPPPAATRSVYIRAAHSLTLVRLPRDAPLPDGAAAADDVRVCSFRIA